MQPLQHLQQHNVIINESSVTEVPLKINEYDDNQETIETDDKIVYVEDGYTHRDLAYKFHVFCECGVEIGYFSILRSAERAKEIHLENVQNPGLSEV